MDNGDILEFDANGNAQKAKEKLKRYRLLVDVLTLTATPIPRTLYMALTGARDMSAINTPPQNRIPVSTHIIEFDEDNVIILRPGEVVPDKIEKLLGKKVIIEESLQKKESSPGKYPKHYSPKAEVIIVEYFSNQSETTVELAKKMISEGKKIGILAHQENEHVYKEFHLKVLGPSIDPKVCAARLFKMLREFDSEGVDVIIAEAIPNNGIGNAVMDRLRKAAYSGEK